MVITDNTDGLNSILHICSALWFTSYFIDIHTEAMNFEKQKFKY